jgi:protein-S-isoprenylcysteine O-methyltransferase Ste14
MAKIHIFVENPAMLTFLLWLFYFALHSMLAAEVTKDFVARKAPRVFRYYRLLYNILAIIGFGALLLYMKEYPGARLLPASLPVVISGAVLALAGTGLVLAAFRHYDPAEFLGTRPVSEESPAVLNTRGLNAWVRHPLYLGILALVAGLWLLVPTVAVGAGALAVMVYLPVGIYLEEKKLEREFGPAYRDYSRRVKRLIPGVW